MTLDQDLAEALGTKLWTTDSFIPRYRGGESGTWKIDLGGRIVNDWGYYTGHCLYDMLPSLARRVFAPGSDDEGHWETWMSLTPHEIESQELAYGYASRHVAIMGLGMGWVAANVALQAGVKKVTVVERDPDVIELFHRSGAFESFPATARQKITLIQADALAWRPEPAQPVDFLYADIWLRLAEPGALAQVRQMQANIQAETIYYWGQELAIHAAARRIAPAGSPWPAAVIQRAVAEVIGLPLLIPGDCDYPGMIEQVIQNRTARLLPVPLDIV